MSGHILFAPLGAGQSSWKSRQDNDVTSQTSQLDNSLTYHASSPIRVTEHTANTRSTDKEAADTHRIATPTHTAHVMDFSLSTSSIVQTGMLATRAQQICSSAPSEVTPGFHHLRRTAASLTMQPQAMILRNHNRPPARHSHITLGSKGLP